MNSSATIRPGDLVEVKTPLEILHSLDRDGTLDHIPFMPEMIEFCGRRFRVSQRALRTCCYVEHSDMRQFISNDVVVLANLRCSGAAHDNCQKSCTIFWREAWVRKVEESTTPSTVVAADREQLRARLRTVVSEGQYFCQASEILKVTIPLSQRQRFRAAVSEVRAGNCTTPQMAKRIAIWIYWRTRRRLLGHYGRGHGTPAASPTLSLKTGELIEIKAMKSISQTLNVAARNRGLLFMPDMRNLCEQKRRVEKRIDKIIMDGTGQMRPLRDTVFLEGSLCGCSAVAFGGCPRAEFAYWRENWLRRAAS